MTRDAIIAWAKGSGWTQNKRGHLEKTYDGRSFCLKLGSKKLQHEVKATLDNGIRMQRISSAYYKDLSVVDGKLHGMKVRI